MGLHDLAECTRDGSALLRSEYPTSGSPCSGSIARGRITSRYVAGGFTAAKDAASPNSTIAAIPVDRAGGMTSVPFDDVSGRLPSAQTRKRAIKQYIEERIGDTELDIAHVVRRFGLSRSTLQRLFRNEGGFASYVREQRLRRAFAILTHRESGVRPRVSGVAYAIGFSDTTAFSRAFRRRFGVTACDVATSTVEVSKWAQAEDLADHRPGESKLEFC